MSWSTPPTWTAGPLSSTQLQELSDDLAWLKAALTTTGITSDSVISTLLGARYGASAYNSSIDIDSGIDKSISFAESDEQWKDDAGMHTDSAPARWYTGGQAGTYQFVGLVGFATNTSGRREVWFEKNDTSSTMDNIVRIAPATGASTNVLCVTEMTMTGGDWVKLMAKQTSGSELTGCIARVTMRLVGAV